MFLIRSRNGIGYPGFKNSLEKLQKLHKLPQNEVKFFFIFTLALKISNKIRL